MTDPGAVTMPRWGKVAIVVATILLVIVAVTSIGDGDGDERPNLIGFDTTTAPSATTATR
jgi:hypothetical protein